MIWETLTYLWEGFFPTVLPLLSVSACFNVVTVSKSLTREEGYSVKYRLSCLSIATKDY